MAPNLLLASSILLPCVLGAGIYSTSGPVLNLNARTYDSLIAKSNHTSIVEFYAPWCGHCQNLKPAYEKAAKSLSGLAKVAAINCDDEENKPFCGSMGVQGFPTLKIVKPNTKKSGSKPIVEDYQGPRTAKAIVEAVIDKIPNHVTRLKEADIESWTKSDGDKVILFTDKGAVSALLRSLAVDFLSSVKFGQVKGAESSLAKEHKVEKLPTLLLLPADGSSPTKYSDEMKRDGILRFLKSVAVPNPDPPAKKAKSSSTKTNKSKASKDSSSYSKAASSHAASGEQPTQKAETIVEDGNPLPTVEPEVTAEKPIKVPEVAPLIQELNDAVALQQNCLNDKAGTCVLLLLPEHHPDNPYPEEATTSLSEIHAKYTGSGRKLFPFFKLPFENPQTAVLRKALVIDDGVEIIAVNAKRSWWRRYDKASYAQANVEDWIDAIRMGEGKKEKLPASVIADSSKLPQKPVELKPEELEELKLQQLANDLPDGVKLDFEELTDDMYEQLLKKAETQGKEKDAEPHDEL